MKRIDYSKAIPLFISLGAVIIITLSCVWYGVDTWAIVIICIFAGAGIAIGVDKYILWKRNRPKK